MIDLINLLKRATRGIQEATYIAAEKEMNNFDARLILEIPLDSLKPKSKIQCEPFIHMSDKAGRLRSLSLIEFEQFLQEARDELRLEEGRSLFGLDEPKPLLIGVCNVSLASVELKLNFKYQYPVFDTYGEILGNLNCEINSEANDDDDQDKWTLIIRDIQNLPKYYSKFVFCEYSINNESIPVLPSKKYQNLCQSGCVLFNHSHTFNCLNVKEDNELLQIFIYGHVMQTEIVPTVIKSVEDKWSELRSLLFLSINLKEKSNENWIPVRRLSDNSVKSSGGFYRIKQNEPHLLCVNVQTMKSPNGLSVIVKSIDKVEIGCIRRCTAAMAESMNSYSDEHLKELRDICIRQLEFKKKEIEHLLLVASENCQNNDQINKLLKRLVEITEEQSLFELPPPNSGIPGSTTNWSPPEGIEAHTPMLVFMDKDVVGFKLAEEHDNEFISLQTTTSKSNKTCAIWDLSSHQSEWLNANDSNDVFIFFIVKITLSVQINRNGIRDNRCLVLRKRLPIQLIKRNNTTNWLSKVLLNPSKFPDDMGLIYDLVYDLPSDPIESKRELAFMAANDGASGISNQSLIKYLNHLERVQCLIEEDQLNQTIELRKQLPPSEDNISIASSADSQQTLIAPQEPPKQIIPIKDIFEVNQRVRVNTTSIENKDGYVRFVGNTIIKKGVWIGVELDEPVGKNDGSYKDIVYFTCNHLHGVFVRPDKVHPKNN